MAIEANALTRVDHVGRLNAIALRQLFPVPAEAKGDGIQGVASLNGVLATGDRSPCVAIDHLDAA